ncbi:hypothetical protein [Paenibacillus graminis]|uniref:hypothetical protein n=1 Tax=Paenibacillus graminis TaxID=189425 RepID=UPI002DB9EC1F|nr:hypothetical protein [Paenibacillus graminis]MEC0167366.1 hypothetical protein [Paenibacillus graminis]
MKRLVTGALCGVLFSSVLILGSVHAEESAVKDAVYTVTSATTAMYDVYAQPVGTLQLLGANGPLVLEAGNLSFKQCLEVAVSQERDTGWQYTLTLDGFTVTHRQGSGLIRADIPADVVSYTVLEPGGGSGIFATGQPQVIMAAPDGGGSGMFRSTIELNMSVPPLLEVSKVEGVPGLAAGQQVGALSGEYRANMMFTLVTGI